MGASKREFQDNRLKCKMMESVYQNIKPELREQIESVVIEPEFDYSNDEGWNELRRESSKAYRKLKEYEYKLRNKTKEIKL